METPVSINAVSVFENSEPVQVSWFSYLVSFILFFLTSVLIFTIFSFWGNPISLEWVSSQTAIFINSLIMFIAPAILFTAVVYFNKKGILVTAGSLVTFLCLQFFILATTIYGGESGLGLIQIYFYILLAVIISTISGLLVKPFLVRGTSILKLFLFPFIIFILVATRLFIYQNPTAEKCASLDIYGQTYCYDRFAEQVKDPVWCYAITTADNIVDSCLKKIQGAVISPNECQKLPYDKSRRNCISESTVKIGDISSCETQNSVEVGGCIVSIIKANKGKNTTDCSVLQSEKNKINCYKQWQMIESGYLNSDKQCDHIDNMSERDLCIFSAVYDGETLGGTLTPETKAYLEKTCNGIKSSDMRSRCIKLSDKYKTY